MLALIFAATQVLAAPTAHSLATHPIENLALAEIEKGTVHIKFHTGGCDPKKVPVSYALRLRQSQIRETPPDLISQGADVDQTHNRSRLRRNRARHRALGRQLHDGVRHRKFDRSHAARPQKRRHGFCAARYGVQCALPSLQ